MSQDAGAGLLRRSDQGDSQNGAVVREADDAEWIDDFSWCGEKPRDRWMAEISGRKPAAIGRYAPSVFDKLPCPEYERFAQLVFNRSRHNNDFRRTGARALF